ncbi:MAG: MaoC family dehydratase N-terminal domain-containing protein [Chloroflexota bacterium]
MAEAQALNQAVEALIGRELICESWEVSKEAIARLAEAVGDPNPLWQDERQAWQTRFGGVIAPPTFVAAQHGDMLLEKIAALNLPFTRVLNGGNEIEFFQPVRPGDMIIARGKLAEAKMRQGSQGRLLFLVLEMTYTNQRGETVVVCRNTLVYS